MLKVHLESYAVYCHSSFSRRLKWEPFLEDSTKILLSTTLQEQLGHSILLFVAYLNIDVPSFASLLLSFVLMCFL